MFFDTRTTQRECQLVVSPVREHRMVEAVWREDGALGQSKVVGEIGGPRFVKDLRMAEGITPVLIDPRVETGIIIIPHFFSLLDVSSVVEFDGIGTSPEENLSWVKGLLKVKASHKCLKVRIIGFGAGPSTFPNFLDNKVSISQKLHLGLGRAVNIIHRTVQELSVYLLPLRMTDRAPVPVTPVELIDGVGSDIVAIHGVVGTRFSVFSFHTSGQTLVAP